MNYFCFLCHKDFPSVSFVISHLKFNHFLVNTKNITLKCISNKGCNREFCTFSGLRRHALACSRVVSTELNKSTTEAKPKEIVFTIEELTSNKDNILDNDQIKNEPINFENEVNKFCNDITSIGISQTNISKILLNVNEILDKAFVSVKQFIQMQSKCATELESINKIQTCQKTFSNIITKFSTPYKRQTNLNSESSYVSPVSINLGGRWEKKYDNISKFYKNLFVQCTFQYIPLLESLKSIFENESFFKLYFASNCVCEDKLLRNFCYGEAFKTNDFFALNQNAIKLQIFYDDFEVVNPLGSKTTVHKIGAIYFTIANQDFNFNSRLENIHLLALFFVNDLKNEGCNMNNILRPIVKDIKILETAGITVNNTLLHGTLASLSHDNLGANTALGFIESFRGLYFCRICEMNRDETQYTLKENKTKLRSSVGYNQIFKNNEKKNIFRL